VESADHSGTYTEVDMGYEVIPKQRYEGPYGSTIEWVAEHNRWKQNGGGSVWSIECTSCDYPWETTWMNDDAIVIQGDCS
jgi:hypothetical protein